MHQFVETIRIEGGKPINLPLHQARMDATRAHFAPLVAPLDLQKWLEASPLSNERIKARVVYDVKGVRETSFELYRKRDIQSLQLVEDNHIDYHFKSTNRQQLNHLLTLRKDCDEVLIVKGGLITDTSFTNVAFYDGQQWLTPAQPLLNGTMRQWLLQHNKIKEAHISPASISSFQRIMLFNAMIDAHELELPIANISSF